MEILKTNEDGDEDGKRRIRCIASSSVKDLHGDTMTAHCVRSMARQAEGLTIFRNHSYRVPDDVFGVVEKSRSKKVDASTAKQKGWIDTWAPDEDVVLLELDVAVSDSPEIDQTLTHIQNGITLGVSIGANITEFEVEPGHEDSWWPPLIINDVDLLEASIVGIPANPLSWVEGATKGLIRRGAVKGVTEETFQEARRVNRAAAEEGKPMPSTKKAAPEKDAANEQPPAPEAPVLQDGADGPEEIVAHYQMQVEAGLRSKTDLDALEDDVQKSIDYALEHGVAKDAFEGRTAADLAKEVLATIPSGEPDESKAADEADKDDDPGEDEGAQESDPESDDEGDEDEEAKEEAAKTAAAAEMKALTESGVLKSMNELVVTLEEALTKLFAERSAREAAEQKNAELADQLSTATANVEAAVELVNKVMELPLARKSAPIQREVNKGLERLKGGVLSEEFLSILYPKGDPE